VPALNFQSRFAPLVESGEKRQTIRAYRKGGRDPKVGDTLYLYTGMRTKACRKLGEATCRSVMHFAIQPPMIVLGIGAFGTSDRKMKALARRDGFNSVSEMIRWFERVHGLPFEGLLIRW